MSVDDSGGSGPSPGALVPDTHEWCREVTWDDVAPAHSSPAGDGVPETGLGHQGSAPPGREESVLPQKVQHGDGDGGTLWALLHHGKFGQEPSGYMSLL